jgi:hypothetical protein
MPLRSLTFCALLVAAPLVAHANETKVDAAPVVARWRDYVRSINALPSLSYKARFRMWEGDLSKMSAVPATPPTTEITSSCAWQGKTYRNEIGIREAKAPPQSIVSAYDGKKYQFVVKGKQEIAGHTVNAMMLLDKKPVKDDPTTLSAFHAVIMMAFLFVGPEGQDISLQKLGDAAIWDALQKRVTGAVAATENNRPGVRLMITDAPRKPGEASQSRSEVFADEATGLPLFARNIDIATGREIGRMSIAQWRDGAEGAPAFPLRVELQGEGKEPDKKSQGKGLVEVVPESLRINQTLPASLFTIPFSQVDVAIENDKIVYARFAPRPPAKAPAKPSANKTAPRR